MTMNDSKTRNLERLLKESGKFTHTASAKYFLQRTQLPVDLLRICIEQLVAGRRGWHPTSLQIKTFLNTLDRNKVQHSRNGLLNQIQSERQTLLTNLRTNLPKANKLIEWLGPANWEVALRLGGNVGICPSKYCGMLIYKNGGCSNMRCACHHRFLWHQARIDVDEIIELCRLITTHKRNITWLPKRRKSEKSMVWNSARNIPEVVFWWHLLERAGRIVKLTIQEPSSETKKMPSKKWRPVLRIEDEGEIIEDVRYHQQVSFSEFEYVSPECSDLYCAAENPEGDESSSSLASVDASFHEFIVVSGGHSSSDESSFFESVSVSWEESSFSVLSECESVHSVDDLSDSGEGVILSYCKVAKLGHTFARRSQEQKKVSKTMSGISVPSSVSSIYEYSNQTGRSEGDCDSDDDILYSIYDGAKSGHGGNPNTRFRGNRRTQKSWQGNQSRSHWTRKKKKEAKAYKEDFQSRNTGRLRRFRHGMTC